MRLRLTTTSESGAGLAPSGSRRWLRPVLFGAGALALLGAAIPAVAAAASSTPVTYFACVNQASGEMKIVSSSATCPPGQNEISWNNVGPAGPTGPQGPQGSPGVVTSYIDQANNVTLSSGYVTVATLQLPAGNYQVSADVSIGLFTIPASDAVSCGLADPTGGFIDFQDTTISTNTTGGVFTANGELTLLGDTNLGGTMTLECADDTSNAEVQRSTIQAIPVSSIVETSG